MTRELKYCEAIHEALDLCLERDPSVYVMGLGVPDPKGIFGTTSGVQEKYGRDRVLDTPTSENGMTGVAIGSALLLLSAFWHPSRAFVLGLVGPRLRSWLPPVH